MKCGSCRTTITAAEQAVARVEYDGDGRLKAMHHRGCKTTTARERRQLGILKARQATLEEDRALDAEDRRTDDWREADGSSAEL